MLANSIRVPCCDEHQVADGLTTAAWHSSIIYLLLLLLLAATCVEESKYKATVILNQLLHGSRLLQEVRR
jgi:hypothetical protein